MLEVPVVAGSVFSQCHCVRRMEVFHGSGGGGLSGNSGSMAGEEERRFGAAVPCLGL